LLVTPLFLALLLAGCVPAQSGSGFARGDDDDATDEQPGDDDDATDEPGDDDDTTDEPGDDDDTTDDPLSLDAWRLTEGTNGTRVAGGELTFADDGQAFAAWMESTDDNGDIWLARSLDGGVTWQEPVPIETGASPAISGGERHPFVVVDAERVAVIWTSNPSFDTWVSIADRTDGALSFSEPTAIGTPDPDDIEDFANGIFLPDGELVVVTHITVLGGSPEEALFITRESEGWNAWSLTDAVPGEPCACCAIDLMPTEGAGLLVAYRNNIEDVRDHIVLTVDGSGGVSWSQASFTNWSINACPMQGPRLLEMDGDLLIFWSDPTAGVSQIWMARSSDGGANWTDQRRITDTAATGGQKWPRVAVDAAGSLHLVFHVGDAVWTVRSDDASATFSDPRRLDTPDGPLEEAELAIGPLGPALVGRSGSWTAGAIWFMPIE